ncbi:RNA-directed DNA polymerase [Arachidicoccus soli]|uniref:RNA-directed DNA polymerase n=1 Tax=Arachidicoccus soli TaxID=2341117 RepID=A0A386HRC4_9BACT|nr:RNA-directed DNA polymerase [Arachidicoccus soli]AYD48222.1 RNA-directed DNA polymerase [Arachidicoccus soli]
MKRVNNIYNQIHSTENLECAEIVAQRGKAKQYGVIRYNLNRDEYFAELQKMLADGSFRTSKYTTFFIEEPKVREIFRLPFFPDRVAQHAAMNVVRPYILAMFTADTYGCIEGRGVYLGVRKLQRALRNMRETKYCLKIDIRKFYPSIDHDILKKQLRRKFKDHRFLSFMNEIIDSAPGLPIGNLCSQYLSNFYLTDFDHWIKEQMHVKHYFRYVDDMIFLAGDKPYLHALLAKIRTYLKEELNLDVKGNYQIFPVEARGIDVLGCRFYHYYTLMRKSIKKNLARAVAKHKGQQVIGGYIGWAKMCNSRHLLKKLLPNERV